MLIKDIRVFHGESVFLDKPSVLASIQSEVNEHQIISAALKGFNSHFQIDFPGSSTFAWQEIPDIDKASSFVRCSLYLVSFLLKRFSLGACELKYFKSSQQLEHIIIAEQNKVVCEQMLFYSILYTSSFLPDTVIRSVNREQVRNLLYYWLDNIESYTKSKSLSGLQQALANLDKPWIALDLTLMQKNSLQIGFGRNQRLLQSTVSFDSSDQGVSITQDKLLTNHYLSQLGFPFPKQAVVSSLADAHLKADGIGFPLVLKCNYGAFGDYVFADLRDAQELSAAYKLLEAKVSGIYNKKIFIEKHLYGNIYRLEVVYGEPLACYQMIPASIVGNGQDNIQELVAVENRKPGRWTSPGRKARLKLLELGNDEMAYLSKQGLTPESIPEDGLRVALRSNSNWSSGGDYKMKTDIVHPDNFELMVQLAAQLRVDILGIDVVCDDISKSFMAEDFNIIEVNHSPGIFGEEGSDSSYSRISDQFATHLTKAINFGDVPVINIQKSEISELLMQGLEKHFNGLGYCSGAIYKDRVNINGKFFCQKIKIDEKNPQLALLRNRLIGALIVERSSEDLLENGLGSGGCDISVITNTLNKSLASTILVEEVERQQIISFLINSSRLGSVIVVNENTDFGLLGKSRADKLFLLTSEIFERQALMLIALGSRGIELKLREDGFLAVNFHTKDCVQEITVEISGQATEQELLNLAVDIILGKNVIID